MMKRVPPPIILAVVTVASTCFAGYGDKVNGLPNWQERAIFVLTNACRMAPAQYRDAYVGASYTILLPSSYPAVPPVYWNLALNTSARFHALEMADTCGLTHNSCNGDGFSMRVQLFYNNKSYTIGEDIAAGYSSPLATMSQWLLDKQSNGTVPADLSMCGTSRCDGHRWNIMNRPYREMGTGYAYGPQTYNYFWCQDLGGGKPDFSNPIVGGVHIFAQAGMTTFLANYFDPLGKPSAPSLYVDNQKTAMTLLMGADSAGTYSAVLSTANVCRSYYFTFLDVNGALRRYPETGDLVTFGEGSCARDFVPPESLGVKQTGSNSMGLKPHGLLINARDHEIVVTLGGSCEKPTGAELFDIQGRKCSEEGRAIDDGAVIALPLGRGLSEGVYLIRVSQSNGKTATSRITVTR
jgi:Cysteine-rich secretory protein family